MPATPPPRWASFVLVLVPWAARRLDVRRGPVCCVARRFGTRCVVLLGAASVQVSCGARVGVSVPPVQVPCRATYLQVPILYLSSASIVVSHVGVGVALIRRVSRRVLGPRAWLSLGNICASTPSCMRWPVGRCACWRWRSSGNIGAGALSGNVFAGTLCDPAGVLRRRRVGLSHM